MAEWLVNKNPALEPCVFKNWQLLSATLGHCYSQYYRCVNELLAD